MDLKTLLSYKLLFSKLFISCWTYEKYGCLCMFIFYIADCLIYMLYLYTLVPASRVQVCWFHVSSSCLSHWKKKMHQNKWYWHRMSQHKMCGFFYAFCTRIRHISFSLPSQIFSNELMLIEFNQLWFVINRKNLSYHCHTHFLMHFQLMKIEAFIIRYGMK
jgi:hypothetical protein